jgi:hypothetical protein
LRNRDQNKIDKIGFVSENSRCIHYVVARKSWFFLGRYVLERKKTTTGPPRFGAICASVVFEEKEVHQRHAIPCQKCKNKENKREQAKRTQLVKA